MGGRGRRGRERRRRIGDGAYRYGCNSLGGRFFVFLIDAWVRVEGLYFREACMSGRAAGSIEARNKSN